VNHSVAENSVRENRVAEYITTGSGSETLLFLHGLGGDHTNWAPQLDALSADYRCIAWTMPGYGNSPAVDELTWPGLADAAAQVLTAAGVKTASVVGLSMGGYVAQQLAADHPHRIDRVVLAATSSRFGRGDQTFTQRFLESRLGPIEAGQTPASLAPTIGPSLLSEDVAADAIVNVVRSMSRISPDAYRRALACLVTWDFTERLCEITQPVLCLAGAHDRTAPVAAAQTLVDGLVHGRLEVLDDCQHLMNLDRPAEFSAALRRFLQAG